MSEPFDVFLCHNSQDKPEVREIAQQLQQQGLKPWLDVWELRPGLPWQRELEQQIKHIKAAAVFVGGSGIGPWQEMEIQAYLRRFVNQGSPVIPVLLPNASKEPELPIFLEGMTWVDFRHSESKPMERLIWGVTGIKPEAQPQALRDEDVAPTVEPELGTWAEFDVVTVDARGQEISRKPGRARSVAVDLGNGVALEMVAIPAGEFLMGTADADRDTIIRERTRHRVSQEDAEKWTDWERPQHRVHVPEFWMGKFAVTQAQWQQVAQEPKVQLDLNPDPAQFKGADRPVEQVSWEDAVEFCDRLAQKTGKPFRLPSEAEWEYACRAGTSTPFYFGETITPDLVNCDGNYPYGKAAKGEYRQHTTEVGSFPPNAFGLYDLHGNVWEWCADPWHDHYRGAPTDGSVWATGGDSKYRVIRGGAWNSNPVNCRAAYRGRNTPDYRHYNFGFRGVCSVFPGLF